MLGLFGLEDGICKPMDEPRAPEVVWLTTPQRQIQPSPANMKRVMEKLSAIEGHRGLCMGEMGLGVRVNPNKYEEQAPEMTNDAVNFRFSRLVFRCAVAPAVSCARFGQPMADPPPPPEAVSAGSGLA